MLDGVGWPFPALQLADTESYLRGACRRSCLACTKGWPYQSAGAPGIPLPGAGTSTAFLSSVSPTHCSTSLASRSMSSSVFSVEHQDMSDSEREGTAAKGNATSVFTPGHPTRFMWLPYSREGTTVALKIKHEHQTKAGHDVSFR